MYRVELNPGTEVLYPTVAELTAAIRCGDVGSQSRIYHRASSSWLPITVHPEYKRISGEAEQPMVLHPLQRKRWTFFNAEGTEPPVEVASQAEVSQAEPVPFPMVVQEKGKLGVRQVVQRAMRWMRIRRGT